ncbi:MAG: lipocalin family protein [Ignavibacteriaceae bacterium]|nr:lipocalin family protein [Ignavibacteriaceae bacterium]
MIFSFQINFSQDKELPKLQTVNQVDLNKYIGLWYEIAKIPNSFQDQCAYGTTAEYKLLEDGNIQVINKCFKEDGEADVADGLAKVVDKKTNSKLEVSFFSILGFRPFWGDYWIIGLDDNYQWAVVGSPNRKYGWILSRTSTLPDDTLQKIFAILEDQLYNPDDFEMTNHKN